jgi:1-acyl-sn-glycerol-3-phosphate acyltransferase
MGQSKLMRSRRFLPLFITQFLVAFNDNLIKNALVIAVTWKNVSILNLAPAQVVTLSGALLILPFLLFSATAGQLADKYEKASLIRMTKLGEILVMVLAFLGFWFEQWEILLLVIFLAGTQSALFGPLKYSILPQLLDESELVGGNALIEAGTFLAVLLGTIIGGVIAANDSLGPNAVGILAVGLSVLGWMNSWLILRCPATAPEITVQWTPLAPTRSILRLVKTNFSVYMSIMGLSWFWLYGIVLISIFPGWCADFLRSTPNVAVLFLAVFSIGIALGSLLCEVMSRKRLELGLVPFGSIGLSLFAFDLWLIGRPAFTESGNVGILDILQNFDGLRILFDLFMMAVFGGLFTVPLYTLVQTRSERENRSRVIAANNVINSIFMVAGSLILMGLLALDFQPPEIFLVLALMNAAVAAYIYFLLPEFMLRFIAWLIASVMYRMQVLGHEKIPKSGPVVLVCNHVTYVDWLLIAAAVKRPCRFVMYAGFYKGILGKTLMKQAKVIPIVGAKENAALMEQAFQKVREELLAGEVICIFPEGTLTSDGKLLPFRPGIERIVKETPVPVVPIALTNVWGSFFSRSGGKAIMKVPKRFWSAIGLNIGDPVPAERVSAAYLQTRVQELIESGERSSAG